MTRESCAKVLVSTRMYVYIDSARLKGNRVGDDGSERERE